AREAQAAAHTSRQQGRLERVPEDREEERQNRDRGRGSHASLYALNLECGAPAQDVTRGRARAAHPGGRWCAGRWTTRGAGPRTAVPGSAASKGKRRAERGGLRLASSRP